MSLEHEQPGPASVKLGVNRMVSGRPVKDVLDVESRQLPYS